MAHMVHILTTTKMARDSPKYVGGNYAIKLRSYTQVHLFVCSKFYTFD